MRRLSHLFWIVAAGTGCLSPVSSRLDRLSDQLEVTNAELVRVNGQLTETTRRLEQIEHATRQAAGLTQPQ
jgi:hypothetical protein